MEHQKKYTKKEQNKILQDIKTLALKLTEIIGEEDPTVAMTSLTTVVALHVASNYQPHGIDGLLNDFIKLIKSEVKDYIPLFNVDKKDDS